MPRLGAADYAVRLSAELVGGGVFGWCVPNDGDSHLQAYLSAKMVEPHSEWQIPANLYILDVDVQKDSRNRGLAKQLMACAISHARSRGLVRVELSWLANDPRSGEVWSRLGFRHVLQRGFLALDDQAPDPSSERPD